MTDTAALRELYAASHGRLVAAVAGMCGSVADAEDCVQEAFAKAVPRWRTLATYDDPEAWVRQVAINLTRSRWRRRRRYDELKLLVPATDAAAAPTPDHVALMAALRSLPADQREAVVLHHLCDLPVAHIAARQGVPEGTVKARLSRGRQALAGRLGMDDDGPPPHPLLAPTSPAHTPPTTPVTMKEVRSHG